MTTTAMKDSKVGDAWIYQACQSNPVSYVLDPATGQPNGNILSGPVRLSFPHLIQPTHFKNKEGTLGEAKYSCSILFPPWTDMSIFSAEYDRCAKEHFGSNWNGAMWGGLDPAWRNQAEKANMGGYTPGLQFMNVGSLFKPAIVDARMNPIVDPSQIYAGVWAIVALNVYPSGKTQIKKGPRFGIQTVMKIGDDTSLEGAAPDPRAMYAGVKVVPPTGPVAGAFGAAPPVAAPPQGFAPPPLMHGQVPQQYAPPPPRDENDMSQFM